MRTIEIKDVKLTSILKERGVVFKEIVKLNAKIEEINQERNKLAYKMERLKEKTRPIIDKLTPSFELKEFEIITDVKINKSGKPEVAIVDRIEEFQNAIREESKSKTK